MNWIAETLGYPAATALVGLVGGILLGLAARIGRFCTLGAMEDYFFGGSTARLAMWGLSIGLALIGSFLLVATARLDLGQTLYVATPFRPLSHILGGLVFGYGMALAGNCGFGALARLGGGDLRSFVSVLVMGIFAFITISGPLALPRLWLENLAAFDLSDLGGIAGALSFTIGGHPAAWGILTGAVLAALALRHPGLRKSRRMIFGSVAVALAVVTAWWGTSILAAESMGETGSRAHSFARPLGETILFIMTSSGGGLGFGVGSVTGVLIGAFAGSRIRGHFRWEACEDPRELRRQIFGSALMGVGAVVALGCSVGQGISAMSVLAFSAPLTLGSIFFGAYLGLRHLIEGLSPA